MRTKLLACTAAVALIGVVACEPVTDPIGDPVDLTYAPCAGASDNPSWVAVQDGDGAWQRVTATSGAYNFTLSRGRGGVALYTPGSGIFVFYATTEELQANLPNCTGSVRTVSGTAAGYVAADNVFLTMGSSDATLFGAVQPSPSAFSIPGVDASVTDLVATRYRTSSSTLVTVEAFPTNVVLRRGISGTAGGTVDFSSTTEGGAPLQRIVSVTNLVSNEVLSVNSNVGLGTTLGNIAYYEAAPAVVSGSTTAPFYAVPGSRLNAGETQMILVGAARQVSSSTEDSRFMTSLFTDPTDRSLTLGPALGTVTVSGTSRPSATYTVQSAYDNLFDVVFDQGNGSSFRQAEVLATKGYLGGGQLGTVTLTVPDLSGAAGFSSTWLLNPGVSSFWTFLATSADFSVLNSKPVTYQGAQRVSTFTP